jgi:hypothetical protein
MKETGFICQVNPVSFNEVAFAGLIKRNEDALQMKE